MPGSGSDPRGCRHCQRAQLAGPDVFDGGWHEVEHDLHLPAK